MLVPGGEPGSLVHSGNGFGSSSQIPGLTSTPSAGLASVQGDAGSAPALAIMLAIIVMAVGAYAGVRARRSSAPQAPPSPS
jgi:hypothetical protein